MEHYKTEIAPFGGRIKAASIGLDKFPDLSDTQLLDEYIRAQKKKPDFDFIKSYFPNDPQKIKQYLKHFGLLRPTIKTDQGMPGNFSYFRIDENIKKSNLDTNKFIREEGLAVPEKHCNDSNSEVLQLQSEFSKMNLSSVSKILLEKERTIADKGRLDYFLIRAAHQDKIRIFGEDITARVSSNLDTVLQKYITIAQETEKKETGKIKPANLLYLQPDVYILNDGTIKVDKVNCPDVGFFLSQLNIPSSEILQEVQTVMTGITDFVVKNIADKFKKLNEEIVLLTRNNVIKNGEDLLEQGDLQALQKKLAEKNIQTVVKSISDIPNITKGTSVILMNIDYSDPSSQKLFNAHSNEQLICYPNPFCQKTIQQEATDLTRAEITPEHPHRKLFLEIIGSLPKNSEAADEKIRKIKALLLKANIESDIVHVFLDNETIPVFTSSSASWRSLATRCSRYPNATISIQEVPLTKGNSLLQNENGGDIMQVYRFGVNCILSDE